jgi:hypothetical protein
MNILKYVLLQWGDNKWNIVHYGIHIEDLEEQAKRFQGSEIFIRIQDIQQDEQKKKYMDILREMIKRAKA